MQNSNKKKETIMNASEKKKFIKEGKTLQRSFDNATGDPEETQKILLQRILSANSETEYGKLHRFQDISNYTGFTNQIPVNGFNRLSDSVDRIRAGKSSILTSEPPVMFNLTSGTTDKPKYIPITEKGMDLTTALSHQWFYRTLTDHPEFLDHSILFVSGALLEGKTKSGIPYGSASGMLKQGLSSSLENSFSIPLILSEISDYSLRYYLIARISLEKKISFIVTPNPSTLIKIAETVISHQHEIIESINDGCLLPGSSFNPCKRDLSIIGKLERSVKANPQRAGFLQKVLDTHGKLVPSEYWKELKLIACWLGGNVGFQVDKLSAYFSKDIPIRDIGYLSSEASVSIPYMDNTSSGILAIQNNYYEFIPVGTEQTDPTQLLRCHELEIDKRYNIIITNHNGLYRYNMNDIIEVTGFYNKTPKIAFIRKSNDMLNITGEKLHINHLLDVGKTIKKLYKIEQLILRLVPDYKNMRYEILMHITPEPKKMIIRTEILPLIDSKLSELNIEYKHKRESKRLAPPIIHIMDSKWEEEVKKDYLQTRKIDVQQKWKMFSQEMSAIDKKHIGHTIS